jgi:ankyrin repeat protein
VQALVLLHAFAANDSVANSDGQLAVHLAASMGHHDIVQYLLKNMHSDIDSQDLNGATPLMLAIIGDHLNIVKMLVSRGANALQAHTTSGALLSCTVSCFDVCVRGPARQTPMLSYLPDTMSITHVVT